jgi:hypothetical protein
MNKQKTGQPLSPEDAGDPTVPGEPESFMISGKVTKRGRVVAGRSVKLFGTDPTHQRLLNEATTDADGRYFIQYDPAEFIVNAQDTTRLFVRVVDNQLPIDSPLFRASPEENADFKISPVPPPSRADTPPDNPIFNSAPLGKQDKRLPDSIGTESEKAQIDQLNAVLPQLLQRFNGLGRAQSFYPYLLVRTFAGDRGDRPLHLIDASKSPDIWTWGGDPADAPEVPEDASATIAVKGAATTVYAHVWNLGRAPIIGVKVEFYWFDLSQDIKDETAKPIGIARVDLAPRTSTSCHKLVKCPQAWVPNFDNEGHQTLIVRVSSIGDYISSTYPWEPFGDRHVAQRDIQVLLLPPRPGP